MRSRLARAPVQRSVFRPNEDVGRVDHMLEGKVAVVTGAGHGIGRGHALELARHGARVVVNDLGTSVSGEGSSKDADLTVDLIVARGGTAVADYGSVVDEADAEAMIRRALDEWGRFDILVNNAGIVRDGVIWNLTAEAWDAVMGVHVRGPWLTSRAAARHWRALDKEGLDSRGRIINTTSGAGLVGNFGQTNYATAKAAVVGLTLTLALELHRFGVTVNAIGPAGATRITGTMPNAPTVVEPDEIPEDSFHPLDPAGSSPVVAWLASDEAQHVTGQVIRVIGDRIHLMEGWTERVSASNDGKRWDASEVADVMATRIFGTRGRGLQTWSS
jgi:NAD(P)-dependent dehydrogenase (short-subunit alcohol dehydrogenase family)